MDRPLITTRGILLIAAVVGAVLLVRQLQTVLLLIAVALMFTAALTPWVDVLTRRGLNRGLAVVLIAVLFLALVVLFGLILVPVLVDETRTLIDQFPELRANVVRILREHHQIKAANQLARFQLQDLFPPE